MVYLDIEIGYLEDQLVDQRLAQPYLVKLSHTTDGNKHRYSQLDIVQRVKDIGESHAKEDVSIKFLLPELKEHNGGGCRKSVRARGDKEHQGNETF